MENAKRDKGFVAEALRKYVQKSHRVLVVGSMTPRREALCVALGALTWTVDYNKLTFDHSKMSTMTVDAFMNSTKLFDIILADSSLDHDGLGRYGDPIAPDADLVAIDHLKFKLKPQGKLILTVPVGPDLLAWNLMRIYGPIRLPLLLESFDLIDTIGYDENRLHQNTHNFRQTYEPVFVLGFLPPASSPHKEEKTNRKVEEL